MSEEIHYSLGVSDATTEKNVVEKRREFEAVKGFLDHNVTGLAVVGQGHTIPTTGDRKITTNWEYWSYCLYGE